MFGRGIASPSSVQKAKKFWIVSSKQNECMDHNFSNGVISDTDQLTSTMGIEIGARLLLLCV